MHCTAAGWLRIIVFGLYERVMVMIWELNDSRSVGWTLIAINE